MAILTPFEHLSRNGRKILIKSPLPEDAESILNYVRKVLTEPEYFLTSPEEVTVTLDEERNWIQKLNAGLKSLAIIAVYNNETVGMLHFDPGHRKRIEHTGDFGMSLDQDFRNDGLGTAMLNTLLAWAHETPGIEKVCLRVHSTNNRAIALYQKFGFVQEGYFKNDLKYGEDRYVDTIFMAKFV